MNVFIEWRDILDVCAVKQINVFDRRLLIQRTPIDTEVCSSAELIHMWNAVGGEHNTTHLWFEQNIGINSSTNIDMG